MKIYALIFNIGISSGYEKLLGLFTDKKIAEEIKYKHMQKNAYAEHHYFIKQVEANKEIDYTLYEW